MATYSIFRILLAIPMLFAVAFVAFVLSTLIPSDPAEVALRINEIVPTLEAIVQMQKELGLNDPFFDKVFQLAL